MYRAFTQHKIRKCREADVLWDVETEDGEYRGKITVPAAWESIPELATYKGKMIYKKNIELYEDTRLSFKGVSHTADVYCDGQKIAHHYNAYTPFSADIKTSAGEHEITVVVDNSYNENSALHVENDYYTYGGIIRPLVIEKLSSAVVNFIHFTPYRKVGIWQAEIDLWVESRADYDREYTVLLKLDEDEFIKEKITLAAGEKKKLTYSATFANATPYSPENPKLYYLTAEIYGENGAVDDLIERVGFREIKCEGKRVLLNDKPIRILGFNRHEDYNNLGSSIPLQAIMRDIALLKGTGANAVRTCHYPNDELFLDICDEMGLLVFEEAHARGIEDPGMHNPNFIPQSEICIDEMIMNHYNHPSIFCWGMLNECASETEYGKGCYERLYTRIRANDKSRPRTSASNRYTNDLALDYADFISMNIYPKWYSNRKVQDSIDIVKNYMKETGNGDKPLLITEIGAGAIYGYRSDCQSKWTEERQATILDAQLSGVLADEDIFGVFIWQFADIRVDEFLFPHRPGCNNNKGIVDMYRRKKLAYATVKHHFEADAQKHKKANS